MVKAKSSKKTAMKQLEMCKQLLFAQKAVGGSSEILGEMEKALDSAISEVKSIKEAPCLKR